MGPYTGNTDNFPTSFDVPDDADIASPNAATFNTALEALGDRTETLAQGYRLQLASIAALKAVDTTSLPDGATRAVVGYGVYTLDKTVHPTFTEDQPAVVAPTTGTGRWMGDAVAVARYKKTFSTLGSTAWVCPPNVNRVRVVLCGGGGGGGGGAPVDVTTSDAPGGGGGGGAALVDVLFDPTPAGSYTALVGDGGAGGASATAGTDGASSAVYHAGPTYDAYAFGGQGGSAAGASLADLGGGNLVIVPGASAVAGGPKLPAFQGAAGSTAQGSPVTAQGGGYATNSQGTTTAVGGSPSPQGGAGGSGGARGTNHTHLAGGGGGGGGAGPFLGADGGDGANGGDGVASGAANVGHAATAATASHYGAGGGGGGGAGAGSSGGAAGGAGAKGAPGIVYIFGVC
jgi:hypothetical protein